MGRTVSGQETNLEFKRAVPEFYAREYPAGKTSPVPPGWVNRKDPEAYPLGDHFYAVGVTKTAGKEREAWRKSSVEAVKKLNVFLNKRYREIEIKYCLEDLNCIRDLGKYREKCNPAYLVFGLYLEEWETKAGNAPKREFILAYSLVGAGEREIRERVGKYGRIASNHQDMREKKKIIEKKEAEKNGYTREIGISEKKEKDLKSEGQKLFANSKTRIDFVDDPVEETSFLQFSNNFETWMKKFKYSTFEDWLRNFKEETKGQIGYRYKFDPQIRRNADGMIGNRLRLLQTQGETNRMRDLQKKIENEIEENTGIIDVKKKEIEDILSNGCPTE
jgi:hypothetical protein